jgi:23S rRNA (uracil1939-C5)-methyltransferase
VADRLEIEGLAPGGEGVAHLAGRPVFVPFTAPGDVVLADVPEGPDAAHASLVELLLAGPERIEAPCPHFGPGQGGDRLCGGCEWLHLQYDLQLRAKERGLVEALRRIGRLPPGSYPLRAIAPSPRPLGYRSRAKFHVDAECERLVFFRRRSHEPVRLRECHLLERGLDGLREALGPALIRSRLRPREVALEWSGHAGRGAALLRGVDLGEGARRRAADLLAEVPSLAGLILEGEGDGRRAPSTVLVGDPVLRHERVPGDPAGGLARSRPDVFQQANRLANARLVRDTLDLLRPDGLDVLELFCGAGNFTGPLAGRAASVSAVEGQGPALELARADLGGQNVRFFAGDALALASALAREGRRFGAVLLDPPREGMKGLGSLLRDLAVPRAVYVSCDPATLARDLKGVLSAGYRIGAVQPVDMFPQTHHVEAVVLLEQA